MNNMETPTKENTLYLPIKQIYFDQIIAGIKKEESREIKEGITANKYLAKSEDGKYVLNPDVTDEEKEYYIELSQRIDSIEVLIEKIQTDSSYIEKLARENLGMVKKDEKVFKFKKIENNDPE